METKFNFTEQSIIELQPEQKKYYEVSDTKEPGLFLRINAGGKKTFFLYKRVNGKPSKITIGEFPHCKLKDARTVASRYKTEIHDGKDHNETRRTKRLEKTLDEVFLIYTEQHLNLFTNTAKETLCLYNLHVRKKIGSMKISSITRMDIAELTSDALKNIRNRYLIRKQKTDKKFTAENIPRNVGHSSINRLIEALSPLFNYAIDNEILEGRNPVYRLKKFPKSERERFLSKDELYLYFNAVNKLDQDWKDYFLLLIYIGSRRTSLLKMKWNEVNFEQGIWTLPATKTKNKKMNTHYLSSVAMEILKQRKASDRQSEFVFPGNGSTGHLIEPKKQFQKIKSEMGLYDFRLHDLRRTLGSHMAIDGASQLQIRDALAHADLRSTQIYARLSADSVRQSIERTINGFNVALDLAQAA